MQTEKRFQYRLIPGVFNGSIKRVQVYSTIRLSSPNVVLSFVMRGANNTERNGIRGERERYKDGWYMCKRKCRLKVETNEEEKQIKQSKIR